MNRDLYEKINDENFNLDNYEIQNTDDLEKIKMKKNFKNKKNKKNKKKYTTVAAAVVLGFGIIGTDMGQIVYAKAEETLSNISYSISKAMGTNKDLEKYTTIVNSEVTNSGVSVKLNEVAINRDKLIISTSIKLPEEVDGYNMDYDIYINGKKVKVISGTGHSEQVDKYTFNEMMESKIENIDNEENLDVKIKIRKIYTYTGEKEEKIKGNWDFEFTTSGSELTKDTFNLDINQNVKIGEQEIQFKTYSENEFSNVIYADLINPTKDNYDYTLVGHDNLGNEVEFFMQELYNGKITFRNQSEIDKNASELNLSIKSLKMPEKSGRIDHSKAVNSGNIIIKIK